MIFAVRCVMAFPFVATVCKVTCYLSRLFSVAPEAHLQLVRHGSLYGDPKPYVCKLFPFLMPRYNPQIMIIMWWITTKGFPSTPFCVEIIFKFFFNFNISILLIWVANNCKSSVALFWSHAVKVIIFTDKQTDFWTYDGWNWPITYQRLITWLTDTSCSTRCPLLLHARNETNNAEYSKNFIGLYIFLKPKTRTCIINRKSS